MQQEEQAQEDEHGCLGVGAGQEDAAAAQEGDDVGGIGQLGLEFCPHFRLSL